MKHFFAVAGLLTLMITAAGPARADDANYRRTVDRSVPAAGAGALNVTGVNGNVHLYAEDGSTVRVHAIVRSRSEQAFKLLDVRASRQGGTVSVTDVCPTTQRFFFWTFEDCEIELDVHYPRAMTVTLNSKNGNVDADDPGGAVTIVNANGNVTVKNAATNIDASNKNGNVSATLAQNWRGTAIALHTHAGNVDLAVPLGFDAAYTATTRMGDVTNKANLRKGPVRVTASTTFGNVTFTRE